MTDNPNIDPGNAGGNAGNGATGDNAGGTGGGSNNAPWYAAESLGLSQETRDFLGAKNYASIEEQVKAHRQFETLARDRNALSGPAAGKLLEWDGFEKLGWTPDASKYTLEKPKLDEGVGYADDFHNLLTKSFHNRRVPLDQAKAILADLGAGFNASNKAMMESLAQMETQATGALKAKWGDKYDANKEMASRALRALGVAKETSTELEDIIGSSALVELFHKIGTAMGEDKLVLNTNGGQGGFGGMSPATARAERLRLQADPEFTRSLTDPRHPLHKQNTEKRQSLLDLEARS